MNTYKDLIQFLQRSSESKFIKFHTARTRKTAIRRLFRGGSFEDKNIFEVDLDAVITEFESRNSSISSETIDTYKSRFSSALKDYIRYEIIGEKMSVIDEFRPKIIKQEAQIKSESINLPCPIRKGKHIIHINNLPIDLKLEELERLNSLIKDFIDIEE